MSAIVAAVAVGAVGVASTMDNGRRAANTAQDAMTQQAAAQADQRTQADAALKQQQEALQAQLDQQNKAMQMQQDAYTQQLAQANDAVKQQGEQFKASLKQAEAAQASQAAQSQAQLGTMQQQFKLQEEAMNKANQKQPDLAGIDAKNRQAALVGQGGTLLTGPSGVKKDDLLLGKNTLLGS